MLGPTSTGIWTSTSSSASRTRRTDSTANDRGIFVDVAGPVGLADAEGTRAAAWGDYDGDGDADLYVGFGATGPPDRLYRNDGGTFVDVAAEVGVARVGETRQPSFVDYDGDGDLDLFVAFRDGPNALYRNDGASFSEVSESAGVGDSRRTVGVAWFDMDGDADLDLFVANQNGDEDAVYRNGGDGTFVEIAEELGMNRPGRPEEEGSVGVALGDYDNDGDVDLFVASYGPDVLWRNDGDGTFTDVAVGTPLAGNEHSVGAAWADYDHDGWLDLYVAIRVTGEAETADHLFRNVGGVFEEAIPEPLRAKGASHGVAWADFDNDGDLDLSLTNVSEEGGHPLYLNGMSARSSARSIQVGVTDEQGYWTRAGATITLQDEASGYVSARVLDTGGGYDAQGVTPAHFGLPEGTGPLTITVSWFERGEARWSTVSGVEPEQFRARWAVLQLGVRQ